MYELRLLMRLLLRLLLPLLLPWRLTPVSLRQLNTDTAHYHVPALLR